MPRGVACCVAATQWAVSVFELPTEVFDTVTNVKVALFCQQNFGESDRSHVALFAVWAVRKPSRAAKAIWKLVENRLQSENITERQARGARSTWFAFGCSWLGSRNYTFGTVSYTCTLATGKHVLTLD